jgi:PAS domain S-box-containing protein
MVYLSLKYGTTDASANAYVWFGVILGHAFDPNRYADGYRFGRLACDLVEKYDLLAHKSKTYLPMEIVTLWTQPVTPAIDVVRAAHRAGVESGDMIIACFSYNHIITDLILRGDPLDEVWRESERGLDFARKAKFGAVIDVILSQQRFIETMRGHTAHFSSFSDTTFDETSFEAELIEDGMSTKLCWYWIIKLQARCISGDYDAALCASANAEALLWSSFAHIQLLDYHYYTALALASSYPMVAPERQPELRERLRVHLRQLQEWAECCSTTFRDKHALVAAETARIEGRELDAEQLYEEAIRFARENGFVHNEGIANELAARFYGTRGFQTIAFAYLRNARYCYFRWGAAGKVRQLDELYPQLVEGAQPPDSRHTIGASIEHLDLATVIKVSQAVSGEIVLDKLIRTLLRTAVEHAGAERGLLISTRGAELRIRAEATTRDNAMIIELCDAPLSARHLPEPVIRLAARLLENVILDDASASGDFANDEYIARRQVRSVCCLPLTKQGRSVALLYLENNLAPRVFTPARIAVLKLLAAQAALSLENSHLYNELHEREAKIRRLVDANIVGIIIWDIEGRILEANDAFLRMVGYDHDDLVSGRLNWAELTPPEWLERDRQRWLPELKLAGMLHPFEKEYLRKDGSRVPVTIGVATFEESSSQGVAFVLDLTERRKAEADAQKMQLELAHANRVSTIGQMTASITHEIRQPISAAVAFAYAAQRWLCGQTPNLLEARQAIAEVIKDGKRAAEVIDRMRDLFKKAPTGMQPVDINDAIREVIDLTRGEAINDSVATRIELTECLPSVIGDRVQLQQVMLNLIVNALEAMHGVSEWPREMLISTARDSSGGILVTVRDSGSGLPAETIENVFNPFYTTKTDGLGMGLSICRSIIEAHGGRLWADTDVPHGAILNFVLPIDNEQQIPHPEHSAVPAKRAVR